MGTPEFAVAPLQMILEKRFNVVAVVTSADKPSGRGLKINESAVKKYALSRGLKVMQPYSLKDPQFIETLKNLQPDIIVVVAFRMLPEAIWKMPPLGTFNLHASLLPQYRGAAPINWAIINGETKTGVTTFFLDQKIDTGNIIMQRETKIREDETAGELHDELMQAGSEVVVETLNTILEGNYSLTQQSDLIRDTETARPAPKIYREDCHIKWDKPAKDVYNLIRGLSPYPAAFTTLSAPGGKSFDLKIFKSRIITDRPPAKPGIIDSDGRTFVSIATADAWISLQEIQLESKKKMTIGELLRGFTIDNAWKTR